MISKEALQRQKNDEDVQSNAQVARSIFSCIKWDPKFDEHIPLIKEIAKMKEHQVYRQLTRIPSGPYYQFDPKDLREDLGYGQALQDLILLCCANGRDKCNFERVDEANSSQEES